MRLQFDAVGQKFSTLLEQSEFETRRLEIFFFRAFIVAPTVLQVAATDKT